MNPKTSPSERVATGTVSQMIATAEGKASGNTQVTPEGFPGPTTILLITARSDSGPGPKHMVDLIQLLKKAGLRVFVASPSNPPYAFEFKKHADKFILIPNSTVSFAALMHLRKQVRKYNIGVVHSHGRVAGIYSRLLSLITKASIVHSAHGVPANTGLSGRAKLLIERILSAFKFDAVFSSESERHKAIAMGTVKAGRESYVIENAIDLKKFAVRKAATVALTKVDPAEPETFPLTKIGAVLKSESTRGHAAYLKIVKETANQGHHSCTGISRQQLAQFGSIPANLEILGPLADPLPWLYSLDIFISTSVGEGQVLAANEAIAAGAICILSKIPAHEPFHTHHAALLFDGKTSESFVQTLSTVKKDRALRDMLLGNARYMLERFNDAESFKLKFLDVYRSAVKRAAGLIL